MSFDDWGLVGLAAYLAGMLAVAELAHRRKRDDTPRDHFLAGRELGFLVLFLTLYATAYSGNSLLGYPGRAYRSGFSFIMATGFMMAIMVVFHALAPRLRPLAVVHGFVTPGDWLRHRFGDAGAARGLRLAVGASMSLALANFLLAQLKAMGHVTGEVTGGAIPYAWGVVGLAVLILFYETRGGMRAVAWTDAAQGLLMLVGLAALLAWLLATAGGLEAVTRAVQEVRPAAVAVPDAETCANWFSTIALLGLASVLYPQAIQRIYAARDGRSLRLAFATMSYMPLATTLVVTLIGVAAIPRVALGTGEASDRVMPVLLESWAATGGVAVGAAVLVFIGALAAIMSTADSCLLSLGSLVARDLVGRSGVDERTTRIGKGFAAAIVLGLIPIALQRDLTLWRLIELKMELLVQCVPAFLLALHWRRQDAGATLAGLLVGTGLAVGLTFADLARLYGVHSGIVGLAVNVVVTVVGTWLRSPPAGASRPAATS